MGYGETTQRKKDIVAKAQSKGQRVVVADDRMLQIDIDSEEDWKQFEAGWDILKSVISHRGSYEVQESASGWPHRHVTVYLRKPATVWQRIALQACLGSHLTREVLNSYRVLTGSDCPIVFFEKPKSRRRIESGW